MATSKKVVPLSAMKKPQNPQAKPTEKEAFVERTANLCRHISTWGEMEDVGDLYESTTTVVNQIEALFVGISQIMEHTQGGGDEGLLALCTLGEDLAREAKRRVKGLYDHV